MNEQGFHPDVEFVTKVTSDNCEKYFQELTQKNTLSVKFAEFRLEFSQNNWSCTKTDNLFKKDE